MASVRLFWVAVALAGLLLAPRVAAQPETYVVRGDTNIGSYAVKVDGTLLGAQRAFGRATLLKGRYGCTGRWPALGLRIDFYNLGGHDPCTPQYGYFSSAVMTGERWRTARGLAIGDASRKLFSLYSNAPNFRQRGQWFWLLTRYTRIGDGGYYPGLEAKVVNGIVVAFRVSYAAGGD